MDLTNYNGLVTSDALPQPAAADWSLNAEQFRGEGMRSFLRVFPLLALAALGAAGCDEETAPPTTPTTPTPTVTESFNGSLSRNGAVTFSFTVGATGQVTATLTTLTALDGTKDRKSTRLNSSH